MSIRVLVADDHEVVRFGIQRLLSEQPDMAVVGEATSAASLFALLRTERCDVLVLDVNMPGSDGEGIVTKVLSDQAKTKIVVYSMYPEDLYAVRYLRAGARAYLSKERSGRELVQAIRKVYAGGRYITPELADQLFTQGIDLSRNPAQTLSERELQVVRRLAAGKRATEIAADLSVSTSTVNTFVYRIKAKLGVRTVVEVVRIAEDGGLLG